MSLALRLGAVIILIILAVHKTDSQRAAGTNVPDNPLWPIFSQLLSAQVGRSLQDINTLGLSDPTINVLWTSYTAGMSRISSLTKPSASVQTTTEPPLPDLYQSSYSFSNNGNQAASSQSNTGTAVKGQRVEGTSPADALYQILVTSLAGGSPGTANLQMLLNRLVSKAGNVGISSLGSASASAKQSNSVMKKTASRSSNTSSGADGFAEYEKLLQQYNQIMAGQASGTTPSSSTSSALSSVEQYTQKTSNTLFSTKRDRTSADVRLYEQLTSEHISGKNTKTAPSVATSTLPRDTFEQQLAIFFPQFKNLFPQSSHGNGTSTSGGTSPGSESMASNNTQVIFDALLFNGAQQTSTTKSPGASQTPQDMSSQSSVLSTIQNMVNSPSGAAGMLSNHVRNVFKTRASRDMGCRFLSELLELEVLPTTPINCMNMCPLPYVNPKQFGVYCVCCPPGVDSRMIDMMSLYKGASYMETPLAVI